MHSKHLRNKGIAVCYECKSVYPFACMLQKTNKCPDIKRHKYRIYMLNSVQNRQHTLCELKSIYFQFQSRIPGAMGLDVALRQRACHPITAKKKPGKWVNFLGSLIHQSSFPQMLLFHVRSFSSSSHTTK